MYLHYNSKLRVKIRDGSTFRLEHNQRPLFQHFLARISKRSTTPIKQARLWSTLGVSGITSLCLHFFRDLGTRVRDANVTRYPQRIPSRSGHCLAVGQAAVQPVPTQAVNTTNNKTCTFISCCRVCILGPKIAVPTICRS